jgi:two-component system sensor kinase FixL
VKQVRGVAPRPPFAADAAARTLPTTLMDDRPPFNPQDEAVRILAAIVESSDDAIIGESLDGTILTWNRGAERLYGYTAQDVAGRSIAVLFPEDRGDELADLLARIRTGQRVQHYETVRLTKDGHRVDVSLTVSPITNASAQIVGAATIARDITERKQVELALQASELRWRSVVASAVDGIVTIDARGRIESFNPAAERLFGYDEAELIGRSVSILMPAPHRDQHDSYLAQYLATGVAKIIGKGREVTGLRRDGTQFPLHLSVGEMVSGGTRRFTGILHDLTARVRMEQQLQEQSALAGLGEMAAIIAHEVKNPLAGIRGAVQVIGGRLPAGSRDAEVAKEIVTRIDGLNGLVQDLLLFARPPRPHLQRLDLEALVRSTASLLGGDPALAGVRVDVEGAAAPLLADPELLKIVFTNVLVNSAHAMHGTGVLHVSLRSTDAHCQLTFHDSGPGIPSDIRDQVLTPFFTTKPGGTGLGLPIAKRLIEAHGGSLAIDCPSTGGTTVIVRLPTVAG